LCCEGGRTTFPLVCNFPSIFWREPRVATFPIPPRQRTLPGQLSDPSGRATWPGLRERGILWPRFRSPRATSALHQLLHRPNEAGMRAAKVGFAGFLGAGELGPLEARRAGEAGTGRSLPCPSPHPRERPLCPSTREIPLCEGRRGAVCGPRRRIRRPTASLFERAVFKHAVAPTP